MTYWYVARETRIDELNHLYGMVDFAAGCDNEGEEAAYEWINETAEREGFDPCADDLPKDRRFHVLRSLTAKDVGDETRICF